MSSTLVPSTHVPGLRPRSSSSRLSSSSISKPSTHAPPDTNLPPPSVSSSSSVLTRPVELVLVRGEQRRFTFSRAFPLPPGARRLAVMTPGTESVEDTVTEEVNHRLARVSSSSPDTVTHIVRHGSTRNMSPVFGSAPNVVGQATNSSFYQGQRPSSPLFPIHIEDDMSDGGRPGTPIGGSSGITRARDRSQWLARALKKHPDLLELHERLRPLSRHPSFATTCAPSTLQLASDKFRHGRTRSDARASPNVDSLSRVGSEYEIDSGHASESTDMLPGWKSRGMTERGDLLTKEAILQLIFEHLYLSSLHNTCKVLEEETRLAFDTPLDILSGSSSDKVSALRCLVQLGCPGVDRLWSVFMPGDSQSSQLSSTSPYSVYGSASTSDGYSGGLESTSPSSVNSSASPSSSQQADRENGSLKPSSEDVSADGPTSVILQSGFAERDPFFDSADIELVSSGIAIDSHIVESVSMDDDSANQEILQDELIDLWDEIDDDTGIAFVPNSSPIQVRAGSLNKLIEFLTDSLHDGNFVKTFLVTYRSFTTPERFLNKLMQRFQVPPDRRSPDISLEVWMKQCMQIQLRVGGVLKQWLDSFFGDFNHALVRTCSDFIDQIIGTTDGLRQLSKNLKAVLEKKIAGRMTAVSDTYPDDVPEPKIPRNIFSLKISIWDVDLLEIARQITISESDYFRKVQPSELLNQAWNKPKLKHRSPHVVGSIERFNRISNWVSREILAVPYYKDRREVLHNIIKITQHLRELQNYNAMLAFFSGTQNSAIHRLRFTWNKMPEFLTNIYDSIKELMNAQGSYKRYREILRDIDPPCVPYLGVYLTDLTFIEDGNTDVVRIGDRSLINWTKRTLVYSVIGDVQQYQNPPYKLVRIPQLQDLLERTVYGDRVSDDLLYSRSLEHEPRGASKEDILAHTD